MINDLIIASYCALRAEIKKQLRRLENKQNTTWYMQASGISQYIPGYRER